MEKNTVLVTEDRDNQGTTWGISFDGPNPEKSQWFEMPDKETAFRLKKRLEEAESPAPLSAATEQRLCGDVSREEIEKAAHKDYPHGSTHPIGSAGRSIYENKLASFIKGVNWLLSQRQPVAPEREETDRKKAMKWWNVQHQSAKNFLTQEYYYNRIPGTLTGREIEVIWRKEGSPSAENKGGECDEIEGYDGFKTYRPPTPAEPVSGRTGEEDPPG